MLSIQHHNAGRRSGAGPLSLRLILFLAVGAALILLGGCEINSPEMPTFDTTLTIPLGVERVDILDALDDEDYLVMGDNGGVDFFIEGDADTMDFGFDLATDIDGQTIQQGLGNFNLAALDPMNYNFTLADIWAPAAGAVNLITPVPAFPIDVVSPGQDIPDVESATLESGSATITIVNNLPVPISADSGPDQIQLVMENPLDGSPVATFLFGTIAAGQTAIQTADLSGVILPGDVQIRLAGGSPGSGMSAVVVNADDSISVDAVFSDLVVSEAVAVVGAQTFQTSFDSDLPQDYEILRAVISSGSIELTVTNDMAIPCTATLTWATIVDLGGNPLSATFDLVPFQTANQTMNFAGRILDGGGSALTTLSADVDIVTPGSGASPVALGATDGLTASLSAGSIAFSSVTGIIPVQDVAIDPIREDIDLPAELEGLELTAATMALHVTNTSGLPGEVAITMTGTSADGLVRTLIVDRQIEAAVERSPQLTTIILDESNSTLIEFLNNLPEQIILAGDVSVGGVAGTIHADDYAIVDWDITAPVEVIINDATIETDPDSLGTDQDIQDMINDHIRGARLETEILNHLPMGVEIRILAGTDTLTIAENPLLDIGPFSVTAAVVDPTSHTVSAPVTSTPTISLTEEQARVFGQSGLYTMVAVRLPSTEGSPIRLLATDYLEIRGLITIDLEVSDE
jgi:hypothetical protein